MPMLINRGDWASLADRPAAFYHGWRLDPPGAPSKVIRVDEDGTASLLPSRTDLRSHTPAGFEFGDRGYGPELLAPAILADAVGSARALALYRGFKWSFVARLGDATWTITREEVQDWAASHEN